MVVGGVNAERPGRIGGGLPTAEATAADPAKRARAASAAQEVPCPGTLISPPLPHGALACSRSLGHHRSGGLVSAVPWRPLAALSSTVTSWLGGHCGGYRAAKARAAANVPTQPMMAR